MQSLPHRHPSAHCFVGGPATGKSIELAKRARMLAASGHESVLMVCAAPIALEEVRELIGGEKRVRVVTARDLALEVISDPDAQIRSEREPHVLDAAEERTFFEDMRPSGLRRHRLHELLAFLCRGWSDLSDEDPDWIQTSEESTCSTLARANLMFTGGILECELANLAVKTLRGRPTMQIRHGADHVLVDDYDLLSRASQVLTNLIAHHSMSITADEITPMRVYEAYPYSQGLKEFLEANPHTVIHRLTRCHRPSTIVRILNGLRTNEAIGGTLLETSGVDEKSATVTIRMEPSLAGECQAIVDVVEKAQARGVSLDRILVVGTSAAWRSHVAQTLETHGIGARCTSDTRQAEGTVPGQAARCRTRTIERLARHPDDSSAWRMWCALGDPLARSAAISRLRQAAGPRGIRLAEALQLLAANDLDGAQADDPVLADLVELYRQGQESIRSATRRSTLGIDEKGFRDPSGKLATCSSGQGTPSSAVLYESPYGEYANTSRETVTICPPAGAFGHSSAVVVFGGFVNGLIPSRDFCDPGKMVGRARKRAHQVNLQSIHLCVSRAQEHVVFTGFTSCGLETSERLGLHIGRIRLRNGTRICVVEPSDLLEFIAQETLDT